MTLNDQNSREFKEALDSYITREPDYPDEEEMTTLREEIDNTIYEWEFGARIIDSLTQRIFSLIQKHIGEKLTVIGDEKVNELLDEWPIGMDGAIRTGAEAQLQHTLAQIKEILR